MYPIKFKPVYKERVWGGRHLANLLQRDLPGNKIGESWELCCHKNGMSLVANGALAGTSLQDIIKQYPQEIFGCGEKFAKFPLMIKFLDANDKLSVQVHPDDEYAAAWEQDSGKTEAWYVMAASEDAQVIYGLQDEISKTDFNKAVIENKVVDMLRFVPVQSGDMIFVPSGLVHALLAGVVACEIQQNSDVTYRIYDHGRHDDKGNARELHIEKAMEVISFGKQEKINFQQEKITCPYFNIEKIQIGSNKEQAMAEANNKVEIIVTAKNGNFDATNDRFLLYCVLKGCGQLSYQTGEEILRLGDTVLLPACLGKVKLTGDMELLRIEPGSKLNAGNKVIR